MRKRDEGSFHGRLIGEHALKPGRAFYKGGMKRAVSVLRKIKWTSNKGREVGFLSK